MSKVISLTCIKHMKTRPTSEIGRAFCKVIAYPISSQYIWNSL
ncbi:hypothetical protein [Bacillus rhizoplanae]